ncbi:MAG: GatB/YqeY domain-containing protein [Peptococcaceae bacterium]|nr:GatB/YqeY domain-containing protein [Peptococcaceae bacterium]
MLYDEFRKEKMIALKEKDKLKNKVITNILSDLTYIKKELKQEPTEADSAKVVVKQVKQLKETMELSKDRPDKMAELEAELAVLEQYMPKQMSEEEIREAVVKLLEENGITAEPKNKGAIMKVVMPALNGKADGKDINKVVSSLF